MNGNGISHKRLWNKDFIKLCMANFFLAMSVYMLLPVLPMWMAVPLSGNNELIAPVIGVFGIGIFLLGGFSSFLIQKYRRNKVCILSTLVLAGIVLGMTYVERELATMLDVSQLLALFIVARLLSGAFYGLAYIVINSTLFVDCCESAQRTSANMLSGWFHRFAIVAGPLCGAFVDEELGTVDTMYISAIACVIAAGLIGSVVFPFKAPEETIKVFCFDRFLTLHSGSIAVPVMLLAAGFGFLLSPFRSFIACEAMAFGVVAAFVLYKLLSGANLTKLVIPFGYVLVGLSSVIFVGGFGISLAVSAFMNALGAAMLLARYDLLFINSSDHCQRGTSQSTFILSVELGIAFGAAVSVFRYGNNVYVPAALFLLSASVYFVFTRKWLKLHLRK